MLAHSLEANVLTIHNFVDLVKIIPNIRGARTPPLGADGHSVGLSTSRITRAITVTFVSSKIDWRGAATAKQGFLVRHKVLFIISRELHHTKIIIDGVPFVIISHIGCSSPSTACKRTRIEEQDEGNGVYLLRDRSTRAVDEVNDQTAHWFLTISHVCNRSAKPEHHSGR
jgi:hypothetical protein